MSTQAYEGWAVVELMGHRQRPGRVTEVEMYGGKLLRVDIPIEGGDVTEFYGVASIYALRPVSEEIARDMAKRVYGLQPVRPVQYQVEHKPDTSDGLGLDHANNPDADEFDDEDVPY